MIVRVQPLTKNILRSYNISDHVHTWGKSLVPEFIDRPAPPPKHTILDNIAETKCMFVLCFFVFSSFPSILHPQTHSFTPN